MASSRKKPAKPVRKRPEQHSENCLHMHCQQWLVKSGMWNRLLIFHVANERKGGIGAQVHFKRLGVRAGVADYLAFPSNGRRVAIELKDEDGELSKEQKTFKRHWEETGGEYWTVRKLEVFQGIIYALTF